MVFQAVPGAAGRPDHGSDHPLEVRDRNCSVEDAYSALVPGVLSFYPDPVCRCFRRWRSRTDIFPGAVLCRGPARAFRECISGDRGCLDYSEVCGSGSRAGGCMNEESLNLGEALRLAREKANRERNRVKCKKYYRNRTEKGKGG